MKARGALSLLAIAAVFSFFFAPSLAEAQYYGSSQIVDFVWVKTFGFKAQWLNEPKEIILQVILPSVAIYAVFLGLLRTLQIFRGMGSMEHVIAAVVMLSSLFMGWIGWVSGFMAVLGVWSIAIFIFLILIGGVLYSIGFVKRTKHTQIDSILSDYNKATGGIHKQMNNYNRHISNLNRRLSRTPVDSPDRQRFEQERAQWIAMREKAVSDLRDVNEAFATSTPVVADEKKK